MAQGSRRSIYGPVRLGLDMHDASSRSARVEHVVLESRTQLFSPK